MRNKLAKLLPFQIYKSEFHNELNRLYTVSSKSLPSVGLENSGGCQGSGKTGMRHGIVMESRLSEPLQCERRCVPSLKIEMLRV